MCDFAFSLVCLDRTEGKQVEKWVFTYLCNEDIAKSLSH